MYCKQNHQSKASIPKVSDKSYNNTIKYNTIKESRPTNNTTTNNNDDDDGDDGHDDGKQLIINSSNNK